MSTTTTSEPPFLVVKLGGEVCDDADRMRQVADDLAKLHLRKLARPVVVHGGGAQVNALSERLGLPVQKISGRRITDKDTLDVVKMMVGGKINAELVAALDAAGASAVGLTGLDAGLVQAKKRPRKNILDDKTGEKRDVDFGYVGDIARIQPDILRLLLGAEHIPVIACLGGGDGNIFNINADTIASEIAVSLKAETLAYISGKPGVRKEPGNPKSMIPKMHLDQIATLISDGVVTEGMIPKLQTAAHALRLGVQRVALIDGKSDGSRLRDALTDTFTGTLILP